MTPDNWDRAKELFEAALALGSAQRASFLGKNCHDENLRQQVERLLLNYQEAGSFLDDPALNPSIPASNTPAGIRTEERPCPLPQPAELLATTASAETEDPMVGRQFGAYKLVRRIGQGGMALVFLAVRADDEYRKQVAVKLVQPGLDSRDLLNRFRNERQTLAGLDHPNIVKLLDGGSTPEGLPYLVMDYVEGSPIDEYCDQHKLSVDDRLHLFGKVCDAVQYAHQKLVIHRDLKPSNILVVADGTPKLLDFGIAKVLNPEPFAQSLQVTLTDTLCMTPAYASPEQMRGQSVTPATDVYSLGVVLYELLTGHRPYRLTQHTPAEIERAICEQEPETPSTVISRVETDTSSDGRAITTTPESVSETREGQPDKLRRRLRGDLDNIVLRALQKEPQRRYESMEEFSQDIGCHLQQLPVKARPSTLTYRASKFARRHRIEVSAAFTVLLVIAAATSFAFNTLGLRDRLASGASHIKIQSLAVIPLANLSGDPTQEYFSDGMTDALITDLAKIGSVKVISRTSSMQYKQTRKSLPEIARELNVDGIVEGTVQRSGDRVRITAQLIHGPSDKHLWADSYERDTRDFFALERDVTADIARQIQVRLRTPEQGSPGQPRPVDPKVLEAYLQGTYHLNQYGKGGGDEEKSKAAEYFQQAIDADPNFAPAWDGLANSHFMLSWSSRQDAELVEREEERAVQLDPNFAEARSMLAVLKWGRWDFHGAEDDLRQVLALNPNNADAHDMFGQLLAMTGRPEEGLKECRVAQQLDPMGDHLRQALQNAGEYDRAIAEAQRILQSDPNNGFVHDALYSSYANKGMYKEASEEAEKVMVLFGYPDSATRVHHVLVTSGGREAIRQYAHELERLMTEKRGFFPGHVAAAYAIVGDKDRAFYWLEEEYKHYDVDGTDYPLESLKINHTLDSLRSDPRYKDLLRRIGLPE